MRKITSFFQNKTIGSKFLALVLVVVLIFGIKLFNNTYITIQFDALEPFENNMPVYYKGFKIGSTRRIKPSKDFKHTLILVAINYKNLKLPKNTTALVKKRDKGEGKGEFDYIELEYPEAPSIYYLKTGSIIKGKSSLDWKTLFSQEADNGKFDNIGDGVSGLLNSLKETSEALSTVFVTINDILEENRPNLLDSTRNLSNTTNNLYDVSNKMNRSLTQERLDSTTGGFEGSSKNTEEVSRNVKELTENLNQMMPYIDATIIDVNSTVCNVNQITAGILETLQRRLGLMKLLIGRPVDRKCH